MLLGQCLHGLAEDIGVAGEEFQHLALHALLRGGALDRLGHLGGLSAQPPLQRLENARL
jgi:hypothetical protein